MRAARQGCKCRAALWRRRPRKHPPHHCPEDCVFRDLQRYNGPNLVACRTPGTRRLPRIPRKTSGNHRPLRRIDGRVRKTGRVGPRAQPAPGWLPTSRVFGAAASPCECRPVRCYIITLVKLARSIRGRQSLHALVRWSRSIVSFAPRRSVRRLRSFDLPSVSRSDGNNAADTARFPARFAGCVPIRFSRTKPIHRGITNHLQMHG